MRTGCAEAAAVDRSSTGERADNGRREDDQEDAEHRRHQPSAEPEQERGPSDELDHRQQDSDRIHEKARQKAVAPECFGELAAVEELRQPSESEEHSQDEASGKRNSLHCDPTPVSTASR